MEFRRVLFRSPYDLPSARYPVLLEKYARFSDALLKFIFLVENRRVIDPQILVFRTAMNVVLYDTRNLMYLDFPLNITTSIPTQLPDGSIFPYRSEERRVRKELVSTCRSR